MIVVEDLTKRYGKTTAIHGLDFHVPPGEVVGLLGPNGAGKSTTLKILAGLVSPDSGRASVGGFDLATRSLEAKSVTGYVPEAPALYDLLTANEFLELVGCLHHLEPSVSRSRRHDLLDLFGLAASADQRLQELSRGMRQKTLISAALLHGPRILILDEPFDGLDAEAVRLVKTLIRDLASQGRTVLFSSHVFELVERVADRILIIDQGRKVADGTLAEIERQTGTSSLNDAFAALTNSRPVQRIPPDFLATLDH